MISRFIVGSSFSIAAAAMAATAHAEIYPRQFSNDYVRTCAASQGLQQYDRALSAEICRCVVKFMEFKLPYAIMLEEFQKSEKGQRNRFDGVISEGGPFCEKLLTDP
jgi:glutathione S-transferase